MFIPASKTRPKPPSPNPPQERLRLEDLKRSMVEDNPEDYQNESNFGEIPGIPLFTTWRSRDECANAKVHTSKSAGISGGKGGAYSIVMSGGYQDQDKGEEIVYTGTGGYGNKFGGSNNGSWGAGIQIEDQTFEHPHNNALVVSHHLNRPVRVIRGEGLRTIYSPPEGYRYDGLYKVTKIFKEKSKEGFDLCRFTLVREKGQTPIPERRH